MTRKIRRFPKSTGARKKNHDAPSLIFSQRARVLSESGVEPEVEWDNDKPTVVSGGGNGGPRNSTNCTREALCEDFFELKKVENQLNQK